MMGAVGGSGDDSDGCEGEKDGEQDSDDNRGDNENGDSETASVAIDSLDSRLSIHHRHLIPMTCP